MLRRVAVLCGLLFLSATAILTAAQPALYEVDDDLRGPWRTRLSNMIPWR